MKTKALHKSKIIVLLFVVIGIVFTYEYAGAAEEAHLNTPTEKIELRKKIDIYCNSFINADDLRIAEQVWATTPETSFTHPRGHESGWEQIKLNFYGKTMVEPFSKRQLKLVSEPVIKIYGNAAVVEFDWDFVATMRDDGSTLHTTGRESQIYINMPNLGWRLVHAHYSGAPATGRGEGF